MQRQFTLNSLFFSLPFFTLTDSFKFRKPAFNGTWKKRRNVQTDQLKKCIHNLETASCAPFSYCGLFLNWIILLIFNFVHFLCGVFRHLHLHKKLLLWRTGSASIILVVNTSFKSGQLVSSAITSVSLLNQWVQRCTSLWSVEFCLCLVNLLQR